MKDMVLKTLADIEWGDVPLPCAGDSCADPTGSGVIAGLIGWAYLAIGVVAVIIIIIAGIQYITSEGEPEKTKRAQATITYTIIGLIIATAAATIVGFVNGAFE